MRLEACLLPFPQLTETTRKREEAEKDLEQFGRRLTQCLGDLAPGEEAQAASAGALLSLDDQFSRLYAIKSFFEGAVSRVEESWQARFQDLSGEVDKRTEQINQLQDRMRGILGDKRHVEGELLHASARLKEARQEIVELKAAQLEAAEAPAHPGPVESEARARAQLLGENNRVLILELEERRQMLNSTKRQLAGSEQAKMRLVNENAELRAHLDRSERLVQELQFQIGARTRTVLEHQTAAGGSQRLRR